MVVQINMYLSSAIGYGQIVDNIIVTLPSLLSASWVFTNLDAF